MLAGLNDKCGIEFNFRCDFSSNAGYRGERIGWHAPFEHCVRLPSPFLVYDLCGEFSVSEMSFFIRVLQGRGGVVSCLFSGVVFSGEVCWLSGFGERDARPCVTRVRMMFFERCPASALKCVGPGPLGDASGSFSLVVASVIVRFVCLSCCVLPTLWVAVVR